VRVPLSLLTERVTVETYDGRTGTGGPSYAARRTIRARLEGARTVVRTGTGTTVTASAKALVQHDAVVAVEDRITVPSGSTIHAGTYTVLAVRPGVGIHHPAHNELLLEGPK
jgi:hypothetical protein